MSLPFSPSWAQGLARAAKAERINPLDELFDEQQAVQAHIARFKALLVGRRGGKTTTVEKDIAHNLLEEQDTDSLFVAQTTETARELIWVPLERSSARNNWPISFDNSKRIATGPHGARLLVKGSETIRELEKRRGIGPRHIYIDECGAIRPSYLQYMVEDIFEPMMMDSKESTLWLSGTPNPTPVGYWHDVTTRALSGWEIFGWDYRSNPHLDQDFVRQLMERRGWTPEHPTFLREYLARWVSDARRLVFRFLQARNVVDALPTLSDGDSWVRVLGLDFGVGDATAAAVLAYPLKVGRDVYVEHTWSQCGLAPSEAADRIMGTVERFSPVTIVGDVGGLGKAYQAEWNRRFPGVEMAAADKRDKRGTLEIVSDCLYTAVSSGPPSARRGLMSLRGNDELHEQWSSLMWDEKREGIAEGQDDDTSDAVMYAFKLCPAFANQLELPPTPEVVKNTTWEILRERDRRRIRPPERYRGLAAGWRGRK